MDTAERRRPGRPPGLQGEELLAVARRTFLELGLTGTTINEIAARAGISKASLYREHKSKHALFTAVVLDWTARGRDAMRPALRALLDAEDVHEGLVGLALVIQAGVLDDDVVRMRRLIAAEADSFPDVAARYAVESWDRNIAALAETLTVLQRRGSLNIAAALPAAEQFTWLAVAGPLNQRTLGAATTPPTCSPKRHARPSRPSSPVLPPGGEASDNGRAFVPARLEGGVLTVTRGRASGATQPPTGVRRRQGADPVPRRRDARTRGTNCCCTLTG